ncbi:MAG: ribbon-helix-helix protein, CopG family [Stellaceae bacterium]
MATRTKKTTIIALPQDELAELDRVREQLNLTRAQALRAAARWYVDAVRRLPPAEDMTPEELEEIRCGKEQTARSEFLRLEDVQHEMKLPAMRKH